MPEQYDNTVIYRPITYHFANETDAAGFLRCVKGIEGRSVSCAIEWRCIKQAKKERAAELGRER